MILSTNEDSIFPFLFLNFELAVSLNLCVLIFNILKRIIFEMFRFIITQSIYIFLLPHNFELIFTGQEYGGKQR